MRLIVLFDLPVKKKIQRKNASRFRKFLEKDGYDMMQFSVYVRICNGLDSVETHAARLEKSLPPEGAVRSLVVTDWQYQRMKILVGKFTKQEKKIKSGQLILL